jgi:hypothetical protein
MAFASTFDRDLFLNGAGNYAAIDARYAERVLRRRRGHLVRHYYFGTNAAPCQSRFHCFNLAKMIQRLTTVFIS